MFNEYKERMNRSSEHRTKNKDTWC